MGFLKSTLIALGSVAAAIGTWAVLKPRSHRRKKAMIKSRRKLARFVGNAGKQTGRFLTEAGKNWKRYAHIGSRKVKA